MSTSEIKTEIHQLIDGLDESFLKVVHSMLDTYVKQKENEIIGFDGEGNPLYSNAMKKEYAQRVDRIKNGKFKVLEDLKKESAKW